MDISDIAALCLVLVELEAASTGSSTIQFIRLVLSQSQKSFVEAEIMVWPLFFQESS